MTDTLGFIAGLPEDKGRPTAVPTEFQIFPHGRVTLVGGEPFTVDDAAMSAVISAFDSRGLDMVIDYEHQTEGGEYSSPDGKAPAAGWIKSIENRGEDGLWAKVEWTEAAADLLAKKEYRYFSPVFLVSKGERRLVELLRVALTNAPRLNWIKPIVAKNANPTEKEVEMEFLKRIAKQLGLPESVTQDQVLETIRKVQDSGQEFLKLTAKETGIPETSNSCAGANRVGARGVYGRKEIHCRNSSGRGGVAPFWSTSTCTGILRC